jgi:hypothetical protein
MFGRSSPSGGRGMKSTTNAIDPSAMVNAVSSTIVSPRYRRLGRKSPTGAIDQHPFSCDPSRAAKQAASEKLGRHSQSIDPSTPTSAAERPLPIMA